MSVLKSISEGCDLSPTGWNALEVLYDTSIAYVDSMVADVVSEQTAILVDPVVVSTADHGENFGESGLLGHRLTVNEPLADVQSVLEGLNLDLPAETLIQHADVFQMIRTDLDIEVEVPAGIDVRASPREVAGTQMGGRRCSNNPDEIKSYNPDFDRSNFYEEDMTTLVSPDIIYRRSENDTELSRLCADGSEGGLSDSELFAEYEAYRRDWVTASGTPIAIDEEGDEPAIDEHIQKHLREMGYLVE